MFSNVLRFCLRLSLIAILIYCICDDFAEGKQDDNARARNELTKKERVKQNAVTTASPGSTRDGLMEKIGDPSLWRHKKANRNRVKRNGGGGCCGGGGGGGCCGGSGSSERKRRRNRKRARSRYLAARLHFLISNGTVDQSTSNGSNPIANPIQSNRSNRQLDQASKSASFFTLSNSTRTPMEKIERAEIVMISPDDNGGYESEESVSYESTENSPFLDSNGSKNAPPGAACKTNGDCVIGATCPKVGRCVCQPPLIKLGQRCGSRFGLLH